VARHAVPALTRIEQRGPRQGGSVRGGEKGRYSLFGIMNGEMYFRGGRLTWDVGARYRLGL